MIQTTRALRFTSLVITVLVLSGCASSGIQPSAPVQISIAPAIDVPYGEVVENVPDHIGVNVRWGGQIIGVEDAENTTRLTVLAYPLNSKGQPEQERVEGFVGGRFIVETNTFDTENGNRFLTVYGPISDKEVLTNGKLTKTIPVVTAVETKEWTEHDRRYARERHRLPYNGLGFGIRLGHANIGYGHYGYANVSPFFYPYRLFSKRGHRGRRFRSVR